MPWSYIEKTFYEEKESGRKVCPFRFLLCYPSGTLREDPGPYIISYEMKVSPFLLLLCYPSGTPRADPGPCIISYGMNVSPFLLLLWYPSGTLWESTPPLPPPPFLNTKRINWVCIYFFIVLCIVSIIDVYAVAKQTQITKQNKTLQRNHSPVACGGSTYVLNPIMS